MSQPSKKTQSLQPAQPPELARFACTFCRDKKIRCSRELPKCASCRPWPGECTYPTRGHKSNRDKVALEQPCKSSAGARPIRPSPNPNIIRHDPPQSAEEPPATAAESSSAEERLSRIETSLAELAAALMTPRDSYSSDPVKLKAPSSEAGLAPRQVNHQATIQAQSQQHLTVHPHHSFEYLDKASQYMSSVSATSSPGTEGERLAAANTLQDLAKSLTTVRLELVADEESRSNLAKRYHVPSKQVGYSLLSTFFRIVERGDVIMAKPSDDVLRRVIFEPDLVLEPGWIVFVDFILVNALAADESQSGLTESLRANTRAALDDARMFLEPSLINIQAFLLLASHGEDYATPNLSWMLMGHACRQMQALGPGLTNLGYKERQQQLSLFWSLFVLDKACSLAFGRPTQLPTTAYENVPLPDFEYLLGYHPHLDSAEVWHNNNTPSSTFGAQFFLQSIALAKITGRVLALLSSPDSESQQQTVLAELDAWDLHTGEVLLHAYQGEAAHVGTTHAGTAQLDEMMLGIKVMQFQHLHMTVLMLRKFTSDPERLLSAARNALELLRHLISTSAHVYNGVVWQLLYYPFAPFFVLFEHIVTSVQPRNLEADLEALVAVVGYFHSMADRLTSLAGVARMLEHTARVFYRAACFVSSGMDGSRDVTGGAIDELPTTDGQSGPVWDADPDATVFQHASFPDNLANQLLSQPVASSELNGINVEGILGCFEPDQPRALKRQRISEHAFDWFSWDTSYYGGTALQAPEDIDSTQCM